MRYLKAAGNSGGGGGGSGRGFGNFLVHWTSGRPRRYTPPPPLQILRVSFPCASAASGFGGDDWG